MFIDTKARCFMEAAKCLNFTRAAEKLYISQPALSKNIASLEDQCGMKLFYRDSRRNQVKLTPAGPSCSANFRRWKRFWTASSRRPGGRSRERKASWSSASLPDRSSTISRPGCCTTSTRTTRRSRSTRSRVVSVSFAAGWRTARRIWW